jgi:serine/threonine protein kinase
LDAEREKRVNEIVAAAGTLAPAARAAYIDETCADNGELREDVERVISEQDTVLLDPAKPGLLRHLPIVSEAPTALRSTDLGSELVQRLDQRRQLLEAAPARYKIADEVARGGQGVIYRVWDGDLRRHLAMKVVLGKGTDGEAATPQSPAVNSRSLGRFLEEAQVTSQLDHPGIVPVHELGLDSSGQLYFTMKLVKGRSLSEVFELVRKAEDGWSTTRVLGVLQKVCDAMAYAHAKGVIHRDLKPANVMVGRFGEVYVMDWGLAKVLGQDDSKNLRIVSDLSNTVEMRSERQERAEDAPDSSLVTMDGDVVGTPAYMSPEQARGDLE